MMGCCGNDVNLETDDVRSAVKSRYAAAARQIGASHPSCCGTGTDCEAPALYSDGETRELPAGAVAASLGCGNPTALAELRSGETVLDLGSGGGIDVLLSARRVGPTGKVYGLDMTDEMLELARENQRQAGIEHVEFLKGEIENIPLPDESVDVILSNCVINLSVDKDLVLREAFRVLRRGGRFAVSDIVTRGPLSDSIRTDLALWAGCIAGALDEREYRAKLEAAGFVDVSLESSGFSSAGEAEFTSAFIRAKKKP